MNARDVLSLIQPLKGQILGLLQLAEVKLSRETTKLREHQVAADGRTTPDDLPHVEPYGFTSRAKRGAEAVIANLQGKRSLGFVLQVFDRRYRLQLEADGEVAIYDDQGAYVLLSRSGIVVEPAAGQTVKLGAGASAGVARVGDDVLADASSDAAFFTWVGNVSSALNALTPGSVPSVPASIGSVVSSGSAIVDAE